MDRGYKKPVKQGWLSKGIYFDYQTMFLVVVLTVVGLMVVFSASSYKAVLYTGDSMYFLKRQSLFAAVGFIAMIVISKINYKKLKDISAIFMLICTILCVVVFFIGIATNGSQRWIPILGQQFQPSEVAKLAIAIYVAHICEAQPKRLRSLKGVGQMIWFPVLCIGLIAIENLSTAIVCVAIIIVILFVASPKFWNIFLVCLGAAAAAAFFIFGTGYRSDRIDAWLSPETSEYGFQTMQSKYAIGSGGLFGRGLGESIQKMGFLPESHNDMIFSVICEELGLFGGLAIIVLFAMLILRMLYIAEHTEDCFGGFLVTGIMTHVAVQFIINIGVVTNTIPPTGVTLPFISYGGTSLLMLLVEMGVVLSVSRSIKLNKNTMEE